MRMNIHHFNHPDKESAEQLCRIEEMLGTILERQEDAMIDTSKILAAVEKERTETASLRTLMSQTFATLTDVKNQLAAAIAAGDPAAIAQAQADLDSATALLNTDADDNAAAIAANTNPAP